MPIAICLKAGSRFCRFTFCTENASIKFLINLLAVNFRGSTQFNVVVFHQIPKIWHRNANFIRFICLAVSSAFYTICHSIAMRSAAIFKTK